MCNRPFDHSSRATSQRDRPSMGVWESANSSEPFRRLHTHTHRSNQHTKTGHYTFNPLTTLPLPITWPPILLLHLAAWYGQRRVFRADLLPAPASLPPLQRQTTHIPSPSSAAQRRIQATLRPIMQTNEPFSSNLPSIRRPRQQAGWVPLLIPSSRSSVFVREGRTKDGECLDLFAVSDDLARVVLPRLSRSRHR